MYSTFKVLAVPTLATSFGCTSANKRIASASESATPLSVPVQVANRGLESDPKSIDHRRPRTVIFSTGKLEDLEDVDRVLYLKDGRIVDEVTESARAYSHSSGTLY